MMPIRSRISSGVIEFTASVTLWAASGAEHTRNMPKAVSFFICNSISLDAEATQDTRVTRYLLPLACPGASPPNSVAGSNRRPPVVRPESLEQTTPAE